MNMTLQRLLSLQLARHDYRHPAEVARHMGAVQGQDYASARSALALRLPGGTETQVQQAINNGDIVRTWAMRGTLHLLHAQDLGWMLDLLGPGILSRSRSRHRELGLEEAVFKKTNRLLRQILKGGGQATRPELFAQLEKNGISTTGQRGIHLLFQASLEQLICHGPMHGKQPAFMLQEEWVPQTSRKNQAESLKELALRYYRSHGPATEEDFIWWSGLNKSQARQATEDARPSLRVQKIGSTEYLMDPALPEAGKTAQQVFLLPAFDEFVVGYRNREHLLETAHSKKVITINGVFYPVIVVKGKVAGTWKRTYVKDRVEIETVPFAPLNKTEQRAVANAAEAFAMLAGKTLVFKAG